MNSGSSLPIGFIVVMLSLTLGVVLYVFRQHRRQRQALQRVAASLANAHHVQGNAYEGELDGTAFRYWYVEGSRNTPPSFHLSIAAPSGAEFRLTRESAAHRFFKRIGISVEVQTGDRTFDDAVYIQSDDPGLVRSAFAERRRREAAQRLLGLGYNRVLLNKGRLEAQIHPFRDTTLVDSPRLETALRALGSIAEHLDQVLGGVRRAPNNSRTALRAVFYSLSIGSAVVGLAAFFRGSAEYPPLDRFELFLASLKYGLGGYAIYALLAFSRLRGSSSSHVHLLTNLTVGLFGLPALAVGLLTLLNGQLDQGPRSEHLVTVQGKRHSHSRDSDTYYIKFASWRAGHRQDEIGVGHGFYNRVEPGKSRVRLVTAPGRYGYEWVEDYRLQP